MTLFETFVSLILSFMAFWPGAQSVIPVADTGVPTSTASVVRVVDGDTIEVSIGEVVVPVRYIGIDTPEPYREGEPECGSTEAIDENTRLVAGRTVTLVADSEDTDKYGRLLRYVYIDGLMVNEILVQEGFATTLTIPPNTRYADVFAKQAIVAKQAGKGIWSNCD